MMKTIFFRFIVLLLLNSCSLLIAQENIKKTRESSGKMLLDHSLEDYLKIKDLRNIIAEYANDWSCSKEIYNGEEIHKVKQLPDGRLIYSSLSGSGFKIWDPNCGEATEFIEQQDEYCAECDFYKDQFAFHSGPIVKTLNLKSGSVEDLPSEHNNAVKELHFLDDSKLASGSFDNTLKIWDINKKKSINTFDEHTGGVGAIQHLSKNVLISGSADNTIKVWDLRCGTKSIKTLNSHRNSIHGVIILSDNILASCSQDGTIKIWDLSKGECIRTLDNKAPTVSIDKLLDSMTLVSASGDSVKLWDANSGKCIEDDLGFKKLDKKIIDERHSKDVVSVHTLKDGRVASGSWDGSIKVWLNPAKSQVI